MKAFATLLDRLVLTPSRNGKLKLLTDYFRDTPDPDRGYGLAAIAGTLDLKSVKPALLRDLVLERMDESALKAQFEEFAEVFLNDAGDAAEEWWINWGRFIGSAREHSSMMDLTFPSVSVESCA